MALVEFSVDGGTPVLVEVDEPTASPSQGIGRVSRGSSVPASFQGHLDSVRDAASAALAVFQESLGPDVITLSFGVKLTAGAGAVIARTAVEGNLSVELVWRRGDNDRV